MSKFWSLLESSVIVQALVTLGLVGTLIFLAVTGRPVPDSILNTSLIALGFYFGSKAQLTGRQAADAAVQKLLGSLEE